LRARNQRRRGGPSFIRRRKTEHLSPKDILPRIEPELCISGKKEVSRWDAPLLLPKVTLYARVKRGRSVGPFKKKEGNLNRGLNCVQRGNGDLRAGTKSSVWVRNLNNNN